RFNEKIHVYGYNYIIILHYLTVIPLFVINMCAALTPISLGHFVWITLLGSAPLYIVYALAGRELATISCVQDIFSAQIILACALLIVVALIPMLIKRYQARH
ncbi:MAG: VTT domain-containing protein, partial [Candidatus Babeliales bacterium]